MEESKIGINRIFMKGMSPESFQAATQVGGYSNADPWIHKVGFKVFRSGEWLIAEFEENIGFCAFLMLFTDVNEESSGSHAEVLGFMDTDKDFIITKFLRGQRVCFYLSPPVREALENKAEHNYIDFIDLVTESNENFSIEIQSFFPYNLEDHTPFIEPASDKSNWQTVFDGVYLYETEDWVAEYLEDLDAEKERDT